MAKGKQARSLVVGTAGHIDHGKTSLVRALTGVETDRLAEEKRRGITIELGFAPWTVASGLVASIVDVPGHEGFVRTMVAGAGGIDIVLLVVSAEDGVMPQTREHMHVCSLLGVKRGVVAVTKVDKLDSDEEAIELATLDVREALEGSVFEEAPIIPCSAVTGAGIEELRAAVRKIARAMPGRPIHDLPILPIDRVFVMKGHGVVVTGTLLSGTLHAKRDALVELVPTGPRAARRQVRVRSLQVRGAETNSARAGTRTALNLAGAGVSADSLHRGDVITHGPRVARSDVLHAALDHLPHDPHPWKHGTTVQLCAGTANCTARLDPLGSLEGDAASNRDASDVTVPAGASGLVRLRLDAPVPTWHGQRLILRGFQDARGGGPQRTHGYTIGGGVVVDPAPSVGRGQRTRWRALARRLHPSTPPTERVAALIADAGALGISRDALVFRAGVNAESELGPILTALLSAEDRDARITALPDRRYVRSAAIDPATESALEIVGRFHGENPVQPGMSQAAVEGMIPGRVAPDVAAAAIDAAIARGDLYPTGDQGLLARPGMGPGAGFPPRVQKVLDLFVSLGTAPPTIKDVERETGLPTRQVLEAISLLQKADALVRITREMSMARESHEEIVAGARARLREHGELDVQALKAITGLSRKFVVPLLEHLDRLQITRRVGDKRVPGSRA